MTTLMSHTLSSAPAGSVVRPRAAPIRRAAGCSRRSVCVQARGGSAESADSSAASTSRVLLDRRSLLLATGAAIGLSAVSPLPTVASEGAAAFETYTDPQDKFTINVPTGWAFGEGTIGGNSSFSGASGSRRTLVWAPEGVNARDINVSIVVTNVSVEFTKMGSFGTPYQFASNLVNSQDRSFLLRSPEWARGKDPIQIAKLVDAKEVSNAYYVEYTVQTLPDPQRHLYSTVALSPNRYYNRLYTVTGQVLESERAKYEPLLLAMVKSLGVPSLSA